MWPSRLKTEDFLFYCSYYCDDVFFTSEKGGTSGQGQRINAMQRIKKDRNGNITNHHSRVGMHLVEFVYICTFCFLLNCSFSLIASEEEKIICINEGIIFFMV